MKKTAIYVLFVFLLSASTQAGAQDEKYVVKDSDPTYYSCQELASEIYQLQEYVYKLKLNSSFEKTGDMQNHITPYGSEVEKAESRKSELRLFQDYKHCPK